MEFDSSKINSPLSIDLLKDEIQKELMKIKQIQRQITKLRKENRINLTIDESSETNNRIISKFIKQNYTQRNRIDLIECSIKEDLVIILKEAIEKSKFLRNEFSKIGSICQSDSFDIEKFIEDFSKMNDLFGLSNENGVKCIKEVTKIFMKLYNELNKGQSVGFLSPLNSTEAESYIRVILTKCGVHGISSTHTAENYLKAIVKLNSDKEKLRRIWNTNTNSQRNQTVLVNGLKEKFSSSNGFDEILLSSNADKKSRKYTLKTIEMKVGDDLGGFFDYIRTNKNKDFTTKISNDIDLFLNDFLKQLIANHVDIEVANMIIVCLNNKYKFTTSGTGYNFNIKIKSKNLRNSLIDSGLKQQAINRILEGAIKQNQIISLIQHGNAHKMVKENGFFTTIDEPINKIKLKTNTVTNSGSQIVEIELHRRAFLPKLIWRDEELLLDIVGFDSLLQEMDKKGKRSSKEYKAYLKLNGILEDALNNVEACKINNEIEGEEIARGLNEIHKAVYFELLKHCSVGLFEELLIFEDGMMLHCLETINNVGKKVDAKLMKYFNSWGIVPYTFHQHWETSYSLENAFRLTSDYMNGSTKRGWALLKEKYIGNLLPIENIVVADKKKTLAEFENNPNWFQRILRDLEPPYKIPDGFNLNHYTDSVRPIIFFNKETMKPVTVEGYNKRQQWFGIRIDLNTFFEERTSFSKHLFQFPLKINVRGVELSQSKEIVEAWKRRLVFSGIQEEQVKLLKTQYNFRKAEGFFNIKLVFAILFEYNSVWNKLTEWIYEYINSIEDWDKYLPSSVNPYYGSRIKISKNKVKFDFSGNGDLEEGLIGIGSKKGEDVWNVRKELIRAFVLPSQNYLFIKLLDDIRNQIWKNILDSPHNINVDETWDYIISNWRNI